MKWKGGYTGLYRIVFVIYFVEAENLRNRTAFVVSAFYLTLIIFEIAFFSVPVSAVEYRLGEIESGKWALYDSYSYLVIINSTQPEEPIENKTQHVYDEITVKSAFSTYAELSITTYSEDGTPIDSTLMSGDVVSGEGLSLVSFFPPLLIAGGLREGDRTVDDEAAPQIRRTFPYVYANASREINQVEDEAVDSTAGYEIAFQARWDRRTGFLCEMSALSYIYDYHENYTIQNTFFIKMMILRTNLWHSESNGTDWSGATIGAAIGLGIIAFIVLVVFLTKK